MFADCDNDAVLVIARAEGPTCHTGSVSCFGDDAVEGPGWLGELSTIIEERAASQDDGSYTRQLLQSGTARIAQKVGEEAVELVIEAKDDCEELFLNEAADLLYHYLVLLVAKGFVLEDVMAVLRQRHK